MKTSLSSFLLLLIVIGCQRPSTKLQKGAIIEKEDFLDCFQAGLQANGREVWCEASGVLYDGKNLSFANDKDMPNTDASVFYWAYSGTKNLENSPIYLTQKLFKTSQKYEDFALSPTGKYAFLTTAFDRIKEGSSEWDGYNALLYWSVDQSPKAIQPKAVHLKAGEKFSLGLREALSKALSSPEFPDGMPYFKIEGLAATHDKLYFGVREEGRKYDDFKYKCKILTASYRFAGDSLVLENNLHTLSDIYLSVLEPSLPKSLALSSIEYDAKRKVFWILTSLEIENQPNCAYLWWATEADLSKDKLHLVKDRTTGQPLKFTHKAEDITVLGDNHLFVIHDDDRNRTKIGDKSRLPHQAAYSIIGF